jgi:hypothetical protein
MKMVVFWVVAPSSVVEVCDVLEVLAASVIRAMTLIALTMEAESTSETSVNVYEITRRSNPEQPSSNT